MLTDLVKRAIILVGILSELDESWAASLLDYIETVSK